MPRPFRIHLQPVGNNSYLTSVIEAPRYGNNSNDVLASSLGYTTEYDGTGAMYYIVIIIAIYAVSIVMMIGSFVKKSSVDQGVVKYMNDLQKLRAIERRRMPIKKRFEMIQHARQVRQYLAKRAEDKKHSQFLHPGSWSRRTSRPSNTGSESSIWGSFKDIASSFRSLTEALGHGDVNDASASATPVPSSPVSMYSIHSQEDSSGGPSSLRQVEVDYSGPVLLPPPTLASVQANSGRIKLVALPQATTSAEVMKTSALTEIKINLPSSSSRSDDVELTACADVNTPMLDTLLEEEGEGVHGITTSMC